MRQLLLLRHAKSSWDDPALPDHARPLNARGRRAAGAMAQAIRELDLRPELVLVSSARRTLQTLEAISPLPGTPHVEPTEDLYLAPWTRLLQSLREVPAETRSVMLIGHNPGLHELALSLVGPADDADSVSARRLAEGYPTCTLTEFGVPGAWADLAAGEARLLRYLAPSDLPEMAA